MQAIQSSPGFNQLISITHPAITEERVTEIFNCVQRNSSLTGSRSTAVPSFLSILSSPLDFIKNTINHVKAVATGDHEAELDSMILLIQAPFNMTTALFSGVLLLKFLPLTAYLGESVGTFLSSLIHLVTLPAAIFGLFLCACEACFEIINLKREATLYTRMKEQDWKKRITDLYFTIKPESGRDASRLRDIAQRLPSANEQVKFDTLLRLKLTALSRRLGFNMTKTVVARMREIEDPNTPNKVEKQNALLSLIQIQCRKKIFFRVLSLIVVALCVTGLILLLCGVPYLPAILLILGSVFSITRLILERGMLDQEGWKFSPYEVLPQWIKDRLYPPERLPAAAHAL